MNNIVPINTNNPSTVLKMMSWPGGLLPFDLADIISGIGQESIFEHIDPNGTNAITTGIEFPEGSKYEFNVIFYTVDGALDGYEATLKHRG